MGAMEKRQIVAEKRESDDAEIALTSARDRPGPGRTRIWTHVLP